ncbi:hypothetical protein QVD17_35146 [Tagetes erecta]|uniref:SOSEKI DIX-like domain-containing protein n=1 Tax=Tagetes erecta TaxID=13708 RepID=A0AAD8NKY2_TARER|nr:hypothetical protein QVD17_35146 [Tagetes erecta]
MEQTGFAMERSFKRRLMDTQTAIANGGAGNEVSGQMRKVHIVYFLCRNGRVEDPHLIRIHHHSRNGVYLRDVKRWLSELRGKDMSESFAWSYKRMYKEGYVWQDLLNDDLITPICDNEYVLKGSKISSTTFEFDNDINSFEDKEVFELKTSPPFEGNTKYPSMRKEYSTDFSTNTSIEIEESSYGSNVTTEDTTKNLDDHKDKQLTQSLDDKYENNPFYETLLNEKTDDNNNNNNNTNSNSNNNNKGESGFVKAALSPTYSFRKSGRRSGMFRNLISCGTANAHEKALVVINKRNGRISYVSEKNGKESNMRQICKEQKLGGFEKRFETNDGSKKSKKEDSGKLKTFAAAYKPVNGPNCSQCGRQFKPEKLHNHMKYCRGLKAMAKSTNSRPKPKATRPHSPSKSMDAFFLTNN